MIDNSRRTTLKLLAGVGTLQGFGAIGSVAAKQGGKRKGARPGPTITEIAAGSDDFEVLVALLQTTGLDEVLAAKDGQYTVFAPTDDAFATIGVSLENGELIVEEPAASVLEQITLVDILLYHVTDGRRYAASVVRAPLIEMLNGDDVEVDGTSLNDGQAEIVDTDVEASNGVIHVIDGVLLPLD